MNSFAKTWLTSVIDLSNGLVVDDSQKIISAGYGTRMNMDGGIISERCTVGYVVTTNEHRLKIENGGYEEFVSRKSHRIYRRLTCICEFHTPWVLHNWLADLLFEQHVVRETQVRISDDEVQRKLADIRAKQEEPPF